MDYLWFHFYCNWNLLGICDIACGFVFEIRECMAMCCTNFRGLHQERGSEFRVAETKIEKACINQERASDGVQEVINEICMKKLGKHAKHQLVN